MARMYYTGEAVKKLGISQRHLMRLLKDGTITEPKMRNSYGYRHWTETEVRRAGKELANKRKRKRK
jgi:DNA-binding transcriptional MerR regulator